MYFLLWIITAIVIGYTRYGFRAIGESRYVLQFFSFFVPFYLIKKHRLHDTEFITHLIQKTMYLAALAGVAAYFYGNAFDLGWEDFRGERYISTFQTFNIVIFTCYLLLKYEFQKKLSRQETLLLILFALIAILSKNRASLVAPTAILLVIYALHGRLRALAYATLIVVVLLVCIQFVSEPLWKQLLISFRGVVNPTVDESVNWRRGIQLVALAQSMETFWLGQGYGGYFNFHVPGFNWDLPIEYPPHNQFLVLLLKTGIIGATLCILTLASYILKNYNLVRCLRINAKERLYLMALLVVIASQLLYGFAYDFIPLYGLYYGYGIVLMRSIINAAKSRSMNQLEENKA